MKYKNYNLKFIVCKIYKYKQLGYHRAKENFKSVIPLLSRRYSMRELRFTLQLLYIIIIKIKIKI